jgi:hypothetical protein
VETQLERAWKSSTVICSHVHFPSAFDCFGSPVRAAARLPVLACGVPCYLGLTRVGDTARFAVVHDATLQRAGDLPRLWLRALADLEHAAGRTDEAEPPGSGSPTTTTAPAPPTARRR